MKHDDRDLLGHAQAVRNNAHAAYSGFAVGAALRDERGAVHVGCNVENASYPLGSCAEANAIGAMIAAGSRHIEAIAIVGGREGPQRCMPCGGCRQRIAEFATPATAIIVSGPDGGVDRYTVAELLPESFVLAPRDG